MTGLIKSKINCQCDEPDELIVWRDVELCESCIEINSAVLDERERCAKVTEWFRGDIEAADNVDNHATIASINTCLDSVAAKIRSGK